jgi:uncharacterized membrane-anchored protein YhcB (DUF1043 family)
MDKNLLARIGKRRLRATFASGPRVGGVDAERGLLTGVQICLEGEAKGHGVWLDPDFIAAVAAQGAASSLGVKVRFGHPSMCADALGTFLGRAGNFRVADLVRPDGTAAKGAVADIKLAEEAHNGPGGRDIYAWIVAAAQHNPDTFGQSIVFTYADFYVVDVAGNKHFWSAEPDHADADAWLAKSVDGRAYAVLDKLHGTDFTDGPAATDGVFSTLDAADPDTLAEEAADLLDAHPRIVAALAERPGAVGEFVCRYNAALTAAGKPAIHLATADEAADKRISSLQAAKDREIDAVRKDLTAQNAKLTDGLAATESAMRTINAERNSLARELAECREQLVRERANLAAVTGAALIHTEAAAGRTWEAVRDKHGYAAARRLFPDAYRRRFGITQPKGKE